LAYYILGAIISLIVFLVLGLIIINYFLKWYSLRKINKLRKTKNSEVAVVHGYDGIRIIVNLFISTYLGIGYLLKYLDLNKQDYNVYLTPSKKEFHDLLKNKNIKIFYGSSPNFELKN